MPKYSRTAKYEELRSRLASDAETEIKTNDLNAYEERLNKVNSANFSAPEKVSVSNEDNSHARRTYVEPVAEPALPEQPKPQAAPSFLSTDDTYTRAFDNEYLNSYIKEVKQYNVDQGNDFSGNTDLNILKRLKGETPTAPSKPYPTEKELPQLPKEESEKLDKDTETIEVPFAKTGKKEVKPAPVKKTSVPVEYLDEEESEEEEEETFTKEDIASEVQRLINGAQKNRSVQPQPKAEGKKKRMAFDDYDDEEEDDEDENTRQRLLNETSQMRAQMDDYEDNLTQVSDKMQKTNQILNIVLIVLIIALMVVLAVVIYWVLMSKGIL